MKRAAWWTATLVVGVATLLATIETAAAEARYYESIDAKPIFRKRVYLSAGTHEFETNNLRPPRDGMCFAPDTSMVVTRPDGASYHNDDCTNSAVIMLPLWFRSTSNTYSTYNAAAVGPMYDGKRSCRRVYHRTAGWWTVTVFASNQLACGRADVEIDDRAVATSVDFGGALISLDMPYGPTYSVETVHRLNGASDTVIVLYDAGWQEKRFNDDAGIGNAARLLTRVTKGQKLLVGSWSSRSQGVTSLVINDCIFRPDDPEYYRTYCRDKGLDSDSDNLSDALEAELGTDPMDHDTDGDGLFDYYEAIGRYRAGEEQEMKRFGADPLRRDLFVELDRSPDVPLPMESAIATVQQTYLDLPSLTPNPDGSQGIWLHVDIGVSCSNRSLCGNWGGSQSTTPGKQASISYDQVRKHMAPVRLGLFHYGHLEAGGAGQGFRSGSSFWADGPCTMAHELGHNLGLNHWGGDRADGMHMNHKASYPSTMNYLFQCKIPSVVSRARFSEGKMDELDHLAVNESNYSPGQNKGYLADNPFVMEVDGDRIDFNHDGRINEPGTGRGVATDLAPFWRAYLRPGWPDMFQIRQVGSDIPSGGGGIAAEQMSADTSDQRVWLFAPFRNWGRTYPSYTQKRERAGIDEPAPWPAWIPGPSMNGLPNGEVTAITFEMEIGRRILLLFPNIDGVLHYQLFDPANPWQQAWQPVPSWPTGSFARNASATVAGDHVEIVWRDLNMADDASNVFGARIDAQGTWSDHTPVGLAGFNTPGLAAGPDGYLYMALARGDVAARSIRFYRRETSPAGPWQWFQEFDDLDSNLDDAYDDPLFRSERRRMQLLFLPYRAAQGAPFVDGSGYLAVFWNVGADEGYKDKWVRQRAYTTGYISPEGGVLKRPIGRRYERFTTRPFPSHSVAAVRRGDDAALYFTSANWDSSQIGLPLYVPFASAIPPVKTGKHADTDDAGVISDTMCRSLWDVVHGTSAGCYCRFQGTRGCAPGEPSELVTCAEP